MQIQESLQVHYCTEDKWDGLIIHLFSLFTVHTNWLLMKTIHIQESMNTHHIPKGRRYEWECMTRILHVWCKSRLVGIRMRWPMAISGTSRTCQRRDTHQIELHWETSADQLIRNKDTLLVTETPPLDTSFKTRLRADVVWVLSIRSYLFTLMIIW